MFPSGQQQEEHTIACSFPIKNVYPESDNEETIREIQLWESL
jgi:hypothetical protein